MLVLSQRLLLVIALAALAAGCKNSGAQYARVIKPGEREMIGSHQAGQETFRPLVDEAVTKLIARCQAPTHQQVSTQGELLPPPQKRVCFVGVENHTSEEIGDFKETIFEIIDQRLMESSPSASISRRFVEAGLRETRLRPDQLFVPSNLNAFANVMHAQGQPFDQLLFAKLTSGTTRENADYQRDYLLTLELVDIRTGQQEKQTASLSKGYHATKTSWLRSTKWWK